MPDDIALEKVNALKCLGATVERVRPASIVDNKHVRPLAGVPPSL
jgi:cysteine synthase A